MRRHTRPPVPATANASDFGYQKRVLDYAFGAPGDIYITNREMTKAEVEKYNKEAEIIDYYAKYSQQDAAQEIDFQQIRRIR